MDKFFRFMEDWVIPLGIMAAALLLFLLIGGAIQ